MRDAVLYIHGKGGSAGEADRYAKLLPEYDVFGLEYHGVTPWETRGEVLAAYENLTHNHGRMVLIANSIGAYFAMNALQGKSILQALFISPVVDMGKLIEDMMAWSHVTEAELQDRGEVETAFGETLSWKYLQYVRSHPITWSIPTRILYGEKDNLTSIETIRNFSVVHRADLEVMRGGEHWFHTEKQLAYLDQWVRQYL